jgi:hypothetical protein
MVTSPVKLSREQSRPEEIADSLSHGAGIVAALVGVAILLVQAVRHGNAAFIVGNQIDPQSVRNPAANRGRTLCSVSTFCPARGPSATR